MGDELFTAVDDYFDAALLGADPVLSGVLAANAAAGLPAFDVAANQGKLLGLLVAVCGARRVLEVGTLGGYSTVWLARALPVGGSVVTVESDPRHAAVARANLERAGCGGVVEVVVGRALEVLAGLAGSEFGLVFVDADKENCAAYFRWAVELTRAGGLIVMDNVVRGGAVLDGSAVDPRVVGTRELVAAVAAESRVSATVVQTVGRKGHDGFLLAVRQ